MAPLVLRSRAERGVSKDAPGGDEGLNWTIVRDAMLASLLRMRAEHEFE